jgi:hypothetical protein
MECKDDCLILIQELYICHVAAIVLTLLFLICMAKSCGKAISFFRIVQCLYILFSASSKRWKVLLDHVPGFTIKSLSNTHQERRIKSVRAIRYQAPQFT